MMKPLLLGAALLALASPAFAQSEREVSVPVGDSLLTARLALPAGKPAAVAVILPGSGPTTRDGDNPIGKSGTYRLLAQGLAAEGIATLRADKRGLFSNASGSVDPNRVFVTDLAADARALAAVARRETGARCVWLIGHSEGSLVALIAARQDEGICGLILVAGAGRTYTAVIRAQLTANPANAPFLPPALKALDEIEAGRKPDLTGMPPPMAPLFNAATLDFLIDAAAQDPARLIAAYRGPVLILQGDADIQIQVEEDAKALKAAQPRAELVVLAGVNHVLKAGTRDMGETLANYADPDSALAPGVTTAIARFIRTQPGTN